MRVLFQAFLVVCLATLSWFQFAQDRSFEELEQRFKDHFDKRPAREILLLGNSRTFFNHMPRMLREIADSAGSPQKLEIAQQAPPGASLEILWNDEYTHSLLQHTWDDVIVQAESRAFSGESYTKSFMTYGQKLLSAIKLHSGKPRLVVNWSYEPTTANPFSSADWQYYQREIDNGHQRLAETAGARLIELGDLWAEVHHTHPEIVMTVDGNHPTLAGSYLFALLLYKEVSGQSVARVTFVPPGLSENTAVVLRNLVAGSNLP